MKTAEQVRQELNDRAVDLAAQLFGSHCHITEMARLYTIQNVAEWPGIGKMSTEHAKWIVDDLENRLKGRV